MFPNQPLTPRQALLRTTMGATMISFSAVFVKLSHVTPTVSAFYRVFLGGVFLLALLLAHREKIWYGWRFMGMALMAGLFFALDLYSWHRSIQYVGPGLATILGNFEVFMVPAVGFLLYGERPTLRFVLSVPPALAGLFMIIGMDWSLLTHDFRLGIYYGIATAVFYTGFLMVLRKLQSCTDSPSAVFNLMVVSLATSLFLGMEMVRSNDAFAIPDVQTLVVLGALGFMCQAMGWLAITRALPQIPAAFVGLVLLLQPALSFVWDVLFFHRETSPTAWAGVALALSAIYLGTTSGSVKPSSRPLPESRIKS